MARTKKSLEAETALLRGWAEAVEQIAGSIRKRAKRFPGIAKAMERMLSQILIAQARTVKDGSKTRER
jgi:hypothetical protein